MIRTIIAVFAVSVLIGGCGAKPPSDGSFALVLTVSNPNPQVGDLLFEEVMLFCEIVGDRPKGVEIVFEGHEDKLVADSFTGDASIIFDASDIGQVFTFSCSALDPQGETITSNEVLVTPTS
jgi:hypothetical protein